MGLHDLAKRPKRDALPVGHAPTLAPGDEFWSAIDVGGQFGHDPALAQPGLPDHRHELDRVGSDGLVEDPLEEREVDLPADERGVVGPGDVGAEARPGSLRVEDTHRL